MNELVLFNDFIKKAEYVTNYYSLYLDLFDRNGEYKHESKHQNNSFFILKSSRFYFKYLYFFLDKQILQSAKKVISFDRDEPLICESVFSESKNLENNLVLSWLSINNFFEYRTFIRMFRVEKVKYINYDFSTVRKPSVDEIIDIQMILEKNFDVLAERIPSLEELKSLLETTYIIYDNNEIASILISQLKGKTQELRYWLVLPKYRKLGYGDVLMKYFLSSNDSVIRHTLWVNQLNTKAIDKYKKNGFVTDKLLNKIFINYKVMKNKILEILKATRPEFNFEDGVCFIDAGYLDSFDLITLVSDLEVSFNTKINGGLIVPENFQSVDSIVKLIEESKNASNI
jgi:acyl carrier protein